MKKITRRTFMQVLGLAGGAAVLTACGGGSSSSTAAGTSGAASGAASAPAGSVYENAQKPASMTWWVHDGMKLENGVDQWVEEFDKKTGIDLDLDIIDNNEYYTKLELAYASNTVPDTFDLNGDSLGSYAAQGAIADLTDLVYESGLYDRIDEGLWDALTLNGRIYGIPREIPSACVTYVRKDWLDRLGMDIPTTYDEFITMLTRFRDEIPECTVPYTAPGLKSAQSLPEFYQGAIADYTKIDGKWVDGMMQDNMLTALSNMQKAYADKLIDTEVVTNTTSACRDQWYAGTVGVFDYWGGNWGQTLTTRVKQNVPEAEVVAIPPIQGAVYLFSAASTQVISNKLSEEQVASIFKYFIEYAHDGGEGQVLFQSGVEGLHWEQQGDKLVPLPSLSNPDEPLTKVWITPWLAVTELELTDKNMDLDPAITDSLEIANKYSENLRVFPVSEQRTMIASDLTTAREGIISKVVMGQMSPEEGIAQYKATAEGLGIDIALEQMNS